MKTSAADVDKLLAACCSSMLHAGELLNRMRHLYATGDYIAFFAMVAELRNTLDATTPRLMDALAVASVKEQMARLTPGGLVH